MNKTEIEALDHVHKTQISECEHFLNFILALGITPSSLIEVSEAIRHLAVAVLSRSTRVYHLGVGKNEL